MHPEGWAMNPSRLNAATECPGGSDRLFVARLTLTSKATASRTCIVNAPFAIRAAHQFGYVLVVIALCFIEVEYFKAEVPLFKGCYGHGEINLRPPLDLPLSALNTPPSGSQPFDR